VYLTDIDAIELLRKLLSSVQVPSWKENKDRISQWYKEIKSHKGLAQEFDQETSGPDVGLKKLRYIFKSILWKSESFQNFFEEYDRGWVENKDIIKSLVNKTLKSITDKDAVLAPLSYQWEDDKQFFADIFDTTLKQELWSEQLIAESAKNWDKDRIAQVDMILLKMALSEMRNFPSIPVKVTINEYIEMSKKYSTPKSKNFINGLLDVLANDLMASGTIKKSGRGLIDNK
jgi:N utilization substance protein B